MDGFIAENVVIVSLTNEFVPNCSTCFIGLGDVDSELCRRKRRIDSRVTEKRENQCLFESVECLVVRSLDLNVFV